MYKLECSVFGIFGIGNGLLIKSFWLRLEYIPLNHFTTVQLNQQKQYKKMNIILTSTKQTKNK